MASYVQPVSSFKAALLMVSLATNAVLPVQAKLATIPLEDMVACSDRIVVGKATSIRQGRPSDGVPFLPRSNVATVEVDRTLKGPTEQTLTIVTFVEIEQAVFEPQQQVVLFLYKRRGTLQVLQGYGGLLPVRDGKVDVPYISDFDEKRGLIKQIEEIVAVRSPCTRWTPTQLEHSE